MKRLFEIEITYKSGATSKMEVYATSLQNALSKINKTNKVQINVYDVIKFNQLIWKGY